MERLIRRPDVEALTGLSRSTIYAYMQRGEFPRPRRIGRQAVGWIESEIEAWVMSRDLAGPKPKGPIPGSPSATQID